MSSQTPDSSPEAVALDQMLVRLLVVAELLLKPPPKPDTADAQIAETDEIAGQESSSLQADV